MPLIVDNKVIETPIRDLLDMLQQYEYVMHIGKLKDVIYKNNNAVVTCPSHKDGFESHPSCNVLLEDKADGTPAGTAYCFTCGYKANFVKFVADCLNTSYRKASEWIISVSNYSFVSDSRDVDFDIFQEDVKEKQSIVSMEELKRYDYIHPYMFQRHLTDEIIEKFDIGFDPETNSITIPVWVDGKCVFIARRRVDYKRFDLPKIHPKPVYGLDYVTNDEVYICESVFNALSIWSFGKQAVALFGTGSKEQIEMLNKSRCRKFIIALDGDEAGRNGTKRLLKGLTNKIVTVLNTPTDGRDINDLSKEEFNYLEETL